MRRASPGKARFAAKMRCMTKIELNGAPYVLAQPTSVAALLQANGYARRPVAVEVNREIVPRSLHPHRVLQDGDRVEIVKAMGGG